MRFVASFKNPLEMKCVLPPVFDCTGGGDEADNEGEARGYQSDGGSISRREQKGEEQDSGPVCEHPATVAGMHAWCYDTKAVAYRSTSAPLCWRCASLTKQPGSGRATMTRKCGWR